MTRRLRATCAVLRFRSRYVAHALVGHPSRHVVEKRWHNYCTGCGDYWNLADLMP